MWHKFAPSLDRGQRIHGSVEGRFVTAIRLGNGKLKCIDTTCYHAGGPLGVGPIEELNGESCITCPWHSYPVSLEDGSKFYQALELDKATKKLLPAGWKKKEHAQRVHDIEDRNGEIWIKLSQDPRKFDSDEYSSSAICAERARIGDMTGSKVASAGSRPGLMSSGQVFQEQRWRSCKVMKIEKDGHEGIRLVINAGESFKPKPYPMLMMNAAELFTHPYIVVRIGSVQRFYTPLVEFTEDGSANSDLLTFSIRVYPKALVSASLARLKSGDMVDIRKLGETDPPAAKTESLQVASFLPQKLKRALLIAGGSGISPLLAVAKSTLVNTPDCLVTLLIFDRTPETALARDVLEKAIVKYSKRLFVVHAYSHAKKANVEYHSIGESQVIFEQKIDSTFLLKQFSPKLAPGEEKILISWSGPPGFLDAVDDSVRQAGFRDSDCFFVPFVG